MGEVRFSEEERRILLDFVRRVIHSRLALEPQVAIPDSVAALGEKGSCFVTLHDANGRLRGCIGSVIATESLGVNLRRNAINAAFHDPRFMPLEGTEFRSTRIEVSIMTEPVRAAKEEFVVGRHGVILQVNNRSAVFLPQVAPEQGWDALMTFTQLALKAGLNADAWRDPGAEFYLFEAEVFGEA